MTVTPTAAEPEVVAARRVVTRYRRRYVIAMVVVAGALILGGSQLARLWAGPAPGVDLGSPARYDDAVRPSLVNGRYQLFGVGARRIKIDRIPDARPVPINVSERAFVLVTWSPDADPPTHLVGPLMATLRYEGEDAITWRNRSEVAVYAGPQDGQLVPVSTAALERGVAVRLSRG